MMKFIFLCMGVVALSLAALPVIPLLGTIDGQRNDLSQVTAVNTAAVSDNEAETDFAALAAELNSIETAAGFEDPVGPQPDLIGGFASEAPAALQN